MMNRKRFLGALSVLIGVGTVNPRLFDSNDDSDGLYPHQLDLITRWRNGERLDFSPARPGDYKVRGKLVFYTHPDFLRTTFK